MNDFLLIHNNNVNVDLKTFKNRERVKFDDDVSIESHIVNTVISKINKKESFKAFLIKDSLSNNYLELLGIYLAHYIRLSSELGEKRYFPIFIITDLNSYILNKLEPLARILFTKHVFIVNNKNDEIMKLKGKDLKSLTFEQYRDEYLSKIKIEPPKDYLSHHGIANEWSIYKWSSFLNVQSEAIKINHEKIKDILYFRYLLAKYPNEKAGGIKFAPKTPKISANIIYIDDQWAKGWKDIFESYFLKSPNTTFSTMEQISKDSSYEEIKSYLKQMADKNEPDLIILDMRLTSDDFKKTDEKKISGIRLLRYIKESIDPGIQVIMLTASGKSSILNEANKYDILGYIKKMHPEDSQMTMKSTIKYLKYLVDESTTKYYLKDIWKIEKKILALPLLKSNNYRQAKIEIESVFEILNTNMKNRYVYVMFAIFKVFEIIVKIYIDERYENNTRYAYWRGADDKIPKITEDNLCKVIDYKYNDTTENKIRALLHVKLNIKDRVTHDIIHSLVINRNCSIHPEKRECKELEKVNEKSIIEWFQILFDILKEID